MNRSFTRFPALLALAGAVSGCITNPPERSKQDQFENNRFETRISAEIRKHHACIVRCIQSDYTKPRLPGQVQLQRITDEHRSKMEKDGVMTYDGLFSPQRLVLEVLDSKDETYTKEGIDAVDHELGHVLYELLYPEQPNASRQRRFDVPTRDELVEYCAKRVQSSDFAPIVSRIVAEKEMNRSLIQISSFTRRQMKYLATVQEVISYVRDVNASLKDRKLDDPDREQFSALKNELTQLIQRYENQVSSLQPLIRLLQNTGKGEEQMTPERAREIQANVLETMKQLDVFKDVVPAARDLKFRTQQFLQRLEEKDLEARVVEIDQAIHEIEQRIAAENNPQQKERLESRKTQLISTKTILSKILEVRGKYNGIRMDELDDLGDFLGNFADSITTMTNDYKLDQILGNENEVLARMIDSLMSLYFGDYQQNKFPLQDADLEFLGRFKVDGEPIFKHFLEKYRLGSLMIRHGIPQEVVQQKLEHATSFIYHGKDYQWPSTEFRIIGRIPDVAKDH